MWTNIGDDTAMESSIVRDLADFDINAPINVTVCFDTDCDVTSNILIKTENDSDSNIVKNNDVENIARVRDLKLKEEIKKEPLGSHGATEQINNREETGHILQEITTDQAEEIHNKLPNNDDSRKRKQQQLQIYKNKIAEKMTKQKKTDDRTEKKDENTAQEKVNASTIESSVCVYNQTPETTSPAQPHVRTVLPNPSMVPPEPDVHVQAKDKANSPSMLSDLADHMRHIIDAYLYQKQYNTSKENFIRLKDRYFNLSYDTVVKIILPMEQNKEFMHLFLKETHRRAAGKSYYKCGYQDYEILLGELMTWVRKNENFMKRKFNNTNQPTEIDENSKIQQELNQRQLGNNKNNVDNLNKSAELNSVCIFSSGSPGSEISINIDPNINRYITSALVNKTNKDVGNIQPLPVSKASQNQSQTPSVITARTNKNKNIINAKKPPAMSSSANIQVMDYQPLRSLEPNMNQRSLIELLTSIDIPTQHIHPSLPQERQSVKSHHELQQSLYHSANVPVQYGQSPSLPPKNGQVTNLRLPYGHSQSVQQQYRQPEVAIPLHEQLLNNQLQVQSHYGNQQNMQQQQTHSVHNVPQYSQSQNRPQQVVHTHSLHQYVSSQPVLTHYENAQQQRSQTHLPNYNQYQNILAQPQAQSNHMFPHEGQIRPAPPPYSHYVQQQHKQPRNSPIQVGLTKPVHPSYEQPHHVLPQNQQSKQTSPRAGQLQQQANNHLKEILEKPQRLEWPNEYTATYSQSNMQQHIQKNTPRSASTDSGFISPLNFNVSADQMVPPPPESEPSPLLITHVTSLNPKVSFIVEGECVICKKRTKKMCMGCMKYYYCSYDCQVKDWRSHQANCKVGTTRGK